MRPGIQCYQCGHSNSCVLNVLCCLKCVGVVCLGIVECREFGALANEFECEVLCCCAIGALNLCESDFAALG